MSRYTFYGSRWSFIRVRVHLLVDNERQMKRTPSYREKYPNIICAHLHPGLSVRFDGFIGDLVTRSSRKSFVLLCQVCVYAMRKGEICIDAYMLKYRNEIKNVLPEIFMEECQQLRAVTVFQVQHDIYYMLHTDIKVVMALLLVLIN